MSKCKKKKEEFDLKDIFCSQEYEQKVENQKALADEKDKEFYNLANEKDFERFKKLSKKIDKAGKEYNSVEAKKARQKELEERAKIMKKEEKIFADMKDELYKDAVREVIKSQSASLALIQRKFKIGFARAAMFVDKMEEDGLISETNGKEPRKIFITKEKFFEMFGEEV